MNRNQEAPSTFAPLPNLVAGIAIALIIVSLEAVYLHWSNPPARSVDALQEALLLGTGAGALVGWIGALFSRDPRGCDRVRFGLPLALLVPLVAAVHLRGIVLEPADALGSAKGVAWFVAWSMIALASSIVVIRGKQGPRPSRSPVPLLLVSLVLLFAARAQAGGFRSAQDQDQKPNVVLIVLDTTRVDRLSAFGYARDTTPALAEFAQQGTRFTRCYSAAPWTLASHAAIFTGKHTSTHNAIPRHPLLDERLPTLAEDMRLKGYHTVSFSKKTWLSEETGLLRGFDEVYDLFNPAGQYAMSWLVQRLTEPNTIFDKGATEIVHFAADWLGKHATEHSFFAFFNFNEAHSNLRPPLEIREQFLSKADRDTSWGRSRFPKNHDFNVGAVNYTTEDLSLISDLYDAEIAYQDVRLGELIAAFQEAGVLDNTLFLITADHGENLGEHGLLGHELSLHETLLHVPLVARWPGHIPVGTTVRSTVENRLLGRLIDGMVGGSGEESAEALAGFLVDHKTAGIVSEAYAPEFDSPRWNFTADERFDKIRKSLVLGEWKLRFQSGVDLPALFDLTRDPGELIDMAQARAGKTETLLKVLFEQEDLWQDIDNTGVEFRSAMQARLQKMGYF